MRKLAQGAEARIFSDKNIILKDRFRKHYRHPLLDVALRKSRTKREAKILQKVAALHVPVPRLLEQDEEKMQLKMEKIQGMLLREALEEKPLFYSKEIARNIALLHNAGIIHGDLTTSNMILEKEEGRIYFIDFGLSFFSAKAEDKAVDLHVLKEALEAKHHKVCKECWKTILDEYRKHADRAEEVLHRLALVEMRGRYKGKGS